MPGVSEASASPTHDTTDNALRLLDFPQEILLAIFDTTHKAYIAKEEHDEPHPLTNLRL